MNVLKSAFVGMLICILFSTSSVLVASERTLKVDPETLYQVLIQNIERIDSHAIAVRNRSKRVSWTEYKKFHRAEFKRVQTREQLYQAILSFQSGFINSHSYIVPAKGLGDTIDLNNAPANGGLLLDFTWPDIAFFNSKTGETIHTINGVSISPVFEHFVQYNCRYAHKNACAREFARNVFNKLIPGIFPDGDLRTVNGEPFSEGSTDNSIATYQDWVSESCKSIEARYEGWKLIQASDFMCTYERGGVGLLKIKYFSAQMGNLRSDGSCAPANTHSTNGCAVLKKSLDRLNSLSISMLIVDVQNNPGGGENTPFIAALSHGPFYDNAVQYRCIPEVFNNDRLRSAAFYGSERAEKWFANHSEFINGSSCKKKYFPIRADFCRGSMSCEMKPIEPSPMLNVNVPIVVVPNGACVSSCDDFVWRMKHYADARIIGRPPVTDSTYARISGIIYVAESGEIQSGLYGDGQDFKLDEVAIGLIRFRLPISKTVDMKGQLVDGDPSVVDKLIPRTKGLRPHDAQMIKKIWTLLQADKLKSTFNLE